MSGFRRDALSACIVLVSVCAVVASFPFDAVSFRPPAAGAPRSAFAAFVSLSAEEEAAAMKAAKSSWNAEAGGVRRLRAELFSSELPDADSEHALDISDRIVLSAPKPVAPGLSPYLPSLAAPSARAIPPEGPGEVGGPTPSFSREELLKID